MTRGQPDYGMYASTTVLAGLSDMAELAVRLGSIVIFDRRGRVVDLDDFEDTILKWNTIPIVGGTAVLDSTDPKSGSQDVKLHVANVVGSTIEIYKAFTRFPSSRLGIEISFARPSINTLFYVGMDWFDGTNRHRAQVRLNANAGTLEYLDYLNAYQVFAAGLQIVTTPFHHHPIKMVVDFSTDMYVRCLYADVEYDLSMYAVALFGIGTLPSVQARFLFSHLVVAAADLYLDDFILTQDEP